MLVEPQKKLERCEQLTPNNSIMTWLTEHIRIHDNSRHGRSPFSKPREKQQRIQHFRFLTQRA